MSDRDNTLPNYCVRTGAVTMVRASEGSEDTRETMRVQWTSGAQVVRWGFTPDGFDEFTETLAPEGADLSRLNNGAPLLDSHRAFTAAGVIGSVVRGSARMDGSDGFADVMLSDAPSAADTAQKIREGSISSVSVGYSIDAHEWRTAKGQRSELYVSRWTPLEISAVPVPADARAQFLRAYVPGGQKMSENTQKAPETPAIVPVVDVAALQRAERERVRFCEDFAARQGIDPVKAREVIDLGKSKESTLHDLWEVVAQRSAVTGPQQVGIGVTVGTEAVEKFGQRAKSALIVRMADLQAMPGQPKQTIRATEEDRRAAGDLSRLTLAQLAVDCLMAANQTVGRHEPPHEIFRRSMMMHRSAPMSTSDFVSIAAEAISTAINRTMIDTTRFFAPFAARQDFKDLRPTPLYDIGFGQQLTQLTEGQATPIGVVTDGKETMTGFRFGRKFQLTGDALAADDIGLLAAFVSTLGALIPATENAYAAGILAANPTMSDGNAFFSAAHNNYVSSGAPPDFDQIAATLDMDAEDLDSNPAAWSPAAYVASRSVAWALKILFGQVVNTQTTGSTDAIPDDMVAPVLTHPSITGAPWYIFGPPSMRGFVVGWKNGAQAPEIMTEVLQSEWAVEYTLRHFFAAAWQNWNGVRKNAGA